MSTKNTGSVFQKKDGSWGYRFVIKIDGKRIDRRCSFDEHGNKFRTKREAAISSCNAARRMSEKNKIVFQSRDEAIEQDYEPCSKCNP